MSTQLITITELAQSNQAQPLSSKAKRILAKIILPKKINGETISKYIKKAYRTGAWRNLEREARALLILLRRWGTIKSHTLKNVLHRILLEIELHTLKGQALYYGIILAMKNPIYKLHELLRNTTKLLIMGIFYLNNPPVYRIYG